MNMADKHKDVEDGRNHMPKPQGAALREDATVHDLKRNWKKLTKAEKVNKIAHILDAFRGSSNRDLARALDVDESTIRAYRDLVKSRRKDEASRLPVTDATAAEVTSVSVPVEAHNIQTSSAVGAAKLIWDWLGQNDIERSCAQQVLAKAARMMATVECDPHEPRAAIEQARPGNLSWPEAEALLWLLAWSIHLIPDRQKLLDAIEQALERLKTERPLSPAEGKKIAFERNMQEADDRRKRFRSRAAAASASRS